MILQNNRFMSIISLATCSFNTPTVTLNMLESFKYHNPQYPILISENSTDNETSHFLEKLEYSYHKNSGLHHSAGVDFLLNACSTDYMLLVDTDVIFHKNIDDIVEKFINSNSTLGGVVQGSRGGRNLYDRICPWFCFFNVKKIKEFGLHYYDEVRFTQHLPVKLDKVYDVGATIYEDVVTNDLKIFSMSEEDQNQYITHFEGMSWRKNCGEKELENLGRQIEAEYNNIIKTHPWHVNLESYTN
jgi:hypothetical protein